MFKIRIAIVLIFLFVMGVVLTVQGVSDVIKINGYVPDFNYDSMVNVKKGSFVQGYVANIYDCYAGETTTETNYGKTSSYTSEEYFLMPLINEEDEAKDLFITISASNIDDRKTLLEVRNDTWEYMSGNTDIDFTEMYIVARVKEMDDDLMPLMLDWLTESKVYSSRSEAQQHVIPYELVIYRNLNAPYISLAVGLVIIAAFAVVGVIVYKKTRPTYPAAETGYYSPSPSAAENTENAFAGGFAENSRPAPVPIPDIPQPLQPDEFFARPARKSAPAEEKEPPKPEPEPQPQAQAPVVVPGDMDGLDTSALNTDGLDYYDTAEESDGYAEYEFSNDGDFADADADSIEISE
ncbi:MAG: hypothetical protein K2J11_03000 [Oscillospiraceae bacterium]|nr:hypothetical protein [Oscillospiraceae bacterium]